MKMPFGKYKNLELSELPDDYFSWLSSLEDLSPYLATAIETESERRFPARPTSSAFGSPPPLAKSMIEAGFKALARKNHPDVGGTDAAMRETLEAFQWLKERV